MKKWIAVTVLLALVVAYFTKPDDKTCIIEGVKAVWGNMTPDPDSSPLMFEQFMDVNSKSVEVKDWLFLKQVKYKVADKASTVAYAAFRKVYPTVKPIQRNFYIPKMPAPQRK